MNPNSPFRDLPAIGDFVADIETRDFLRTYMVKLSDVDRETLWASARGKSIKEIAGFYGIGERAARKRLATALGRLRELAGVVV